MLMQTECFTHMSPPYNATAQEEQPVLSCFLLQTLAQDTSYRAIQPVPDLCYDARTAGAVAP